MKIKIRDAVKKDMLQVHNLIVELAVPSLICEPVSGTEKSKFDK